MSDRRRDLDSIFNGLLERPHPQSAGTIKLQRWGGTRKHPKNINSNREMACVLEGNKYIFVQDFFVLRIFVPWEHRWGGHIHMGKNMGFQFASW